MRVKGLSDRWSKRSSAIVLFLFLSIYIASLAGCSSPAARPISISHTTSINTNFNSTVYEAGTTAVSTNASIAISKSTNLNVAIAGTINVQAGGIGINQGSVTADPELKGLAKRLADGRFVSGSLVMGDPTVVIEELQAAQDCIAKKDYGQALEHCRAAIKARADGEAQAMQTHGQIMVTSRVSADGVAEMFGYAAECCLLLGKPHEGLAFADKGLAEITNNWSGIMRNRWAEAKVNTIRAEALGSLNRKDEARAAVSQARLLDPDLEPAAELQKQLEK